MIILGQGHWDGQCQEINTQVHCRQIFLSLFEVKLKLNKNILNCEFLN